MSHVATDHDPVQLREARAKRLASRHIRLAGDQNDPLNARVGLERSSECSRMDRPATSMKILLTRAPIRVPNPPATMIAAALIAPLVHGLAAARHRRARSCR